MSKLLMTLLAVLIAHVPFTAYAQTPPNPQQAASAQTTTPATAVPEPRPDSARQMQLDLDQMEGLLNNMAAQVNFIRDTNMSILLNTNVRLWSVLLRDLRLQLQEQQKQARPAPAAPPQR